MRHLAIVAAVLVTTVMAVGAMAHAADRSRCDDVRKTVQPQLDAACPCASAENRATYTRCVGDKLRELSACHRGPDGTQQCGPVPRICLFAFRRAAARSSCGEPNAITCCLPRQQACRNDQHPGDGKAEGTCSRTHKACDTSRDCVIPECRLSTSADACKKAGGTPGIGKDCGTACAAAPTTVPTPAPTP